jgi:DNA invertase Pin-like site-specific DNA recombinase
VRIPRRCLGYARVSSAEQAIGTSLQDQQDAITAYAQARGLKVERMYVEAESAVHEKIERREQIRLLCADVRAGDLVLVDKLDRWSRDPEFTYRSIREILAAKAGFYAVGDACDPSTPEGDTMLGFRVLFAREEHKRIKQRMVGTRKLLRDRGYYADGLPPLGYRRQDVRGVQRNVLVIEPEEAEMVRRAFRLCLSGSALSAIAGEVGRPFDQVAKTLKNRIYLGEVRDGHGQWIKGQHEPLIDAETFLEAAAALRSRRHGSRPPETGAETSTWWLRDVARCALCGAKMSAVYGGTPERRRHYFACAHRCTSKLVRVGDAEHACDPLVVAHLEALRDSLASARSSREPKASTASLAERRARVQRKRERFLEAFGDGVMTRDELRLAIGKLDEERTRIDALSAPARVSSPEDRRQALRGIEAVRGAWRKAGPAKRRAWMMTLARAVAIAHGREPQIDWFDAEDLIRRGGR